MRKPSGSRGPPPLSEIKALWHKETRLLDLTGYGDWLTLGELYTSVAVFGVTGSGKSSALAPLAAALMDIDAGFVWPCAKPQEVSTALKIARACGREKDVIVLGKHEDGIITRHRFNPLQDELSIPTNSSDSVMRYLAALQKLLARKEGEQASAEGGRYWDEQFEAALWHLIATARCAGLTPTISLLSRIFADAPKSVEMFQEDGWAQRSACWDCLLKAQERVRSGECDPEDFQQIYDYWCQRYRDLHDKTRSNIDSMVTAFFDGFTAEEPFRSLLSGDSTVTPEDVIERGKIVILSLPTAEYHAKGRMSQYAFLYSLQRALLRRKRPSDNSPLRPVVCFVDEAANFCSREDSLFFREVRSNCCINIYLAQGIGGYLEALDYKDMAQIDTYLQNLATRIYFANNSIETNRFAAESIGKALIDKPTSSFNFSVGPPNIGSSSTQEERHRILAGMFQTLQTGGPANGCVVTGYVQRQKIFKKSGTNVCLCRFPQSAEFSA